MSNSQYKVIVKASVTIQVEVSRFGMGHTMEEIQKTASKEAADAVRNMITVNGTAYKMMVNPDIDVFSILVKEANT